MIQHVDVLIDDSEQRVGVRATGEAGLFVYYFVFRSPLASTVQ